NWKESVERVLSLRKARADSDKAAAEAKKRFMDSNGEIPPDELLRTTTLKEETASQYIAALYSHALALAALERVTAGGLRPPYAGNREEMAQTLAEGGSCFVRALASVWAPWRGWRSPGEPRPMRSRSACAGASSPTSSPPSRTSSRGVSAAS